MGLENDDSFFTARENKKYYPPSEYLFEVVNASNNGKFDFKTYSNNQIKGIVFILNPQNYSCDNFSKMISVIYEV